jgi:hypothetical protein
MLRLTPLFSGGALTYAARCRLPMRLMTRITLQISDAPMP